MLGVQNKTPLYTLTAVISFYLYAVIEKRAKQY